MNNKDRIAAGEELINDLRYDADTGLFWWKRKRARNTNLTKPAGTNCNGYVHIGISDDNGKFWQFKAHILAWRLHYGTWPDKQLDHIDRNRSNNRIVNLRLVTHQENHLNRGVNKKNKLGYQNICMNGKSYQVHVMIYGENINRKTFRSLSDAISHRDAIRAEYGFPPATDRPVIAAE